MSPENQDVDYSKPVAYDNEGRPLYAHPPTKGVESNSDGVKPADTHASIHIMRPLQPDAPEITPELLEKHQKSVKKFPHLNLSKGEYVISAVRRHPIGLVPIFAITGTLILLCLGAIPFYSQFLSENTAGGTAPAAAVVTILAVLLSSLVAIGAYLAVYIYLSNRFFLTNESVIQEIQISLFSKHEQTVSLANIEDASFKQSSIFQIIFNYGTIRLSTEGDETTYRFSYVANPKKEIAVLNNAVEAFKNGRPITED
jgi:uncharacterized membrane protein YdbT with pleckstrin-like domain